MAQCLTVSIPLFEIVKETSLYSSQSPQVRHNIFPLSAKFYLKSPFFNVLGPVSFAQQPITAHLIHLGHIITCFV